MRFTIANTWDGAPVGADETVTVEVLDGGADLIVRVDAPYHGDPAPSGEGSRDGLWEFEVVELFVAGPGDAYAEIELGPHGHWLVLQLAGVRNAVARGLPLAYAARIAGGRWTGEARVPRSYLPARPHRANAYAIHGAGEARRYLCATPLPGPKPDFHQPSRFPPVTLP